MALMWRRQAGKNGLVETGLTGPGGFFFWTRFENLVAKRRKINDRVVPILVAIRIGMTSYACRDPRKSLSLPSVLLLAV